ncbi:hypothetical protein ABZ348_30920 [Streptomyces sp. NPDC005963]|uniref:hypothetical protein n=1 Tax=Streptomyces sp. NPDC005963 TaxID=3156721 RepID=UPI003409A135
MAELFTPASLAVQIPGGEGEGEDFTTLDGLITLHIDERECDFHIDARPGYRPRSMKAVLTAAARRGIEPLDEDECDPEILEDGTVRIYCAQTPAHPSRKPVGAHPATCVPAELLPLKGALVWR